MDPNEEDAPNKITRPPKRIVWTFPTAKPETGTSENITSDLQSQNVLNSSESMSTVLQEKSTAATTDKVNPNSVTASAAAPTKGKVDFKCIGPAIVQATINNPALMPELVLHPSEEAILKSQETTFKSKNHKFKNAGPALVAKSTSDIALAHFTTDEQNVVSDLHENSCIKARNSKFSAIGPAILQGTLSHPFAWLKDFKARDEIFPPLEKTGENPADLDLNKGTTTTDPKPGPSNINRNQCLQPPLKILVKSAELNETKGTSKINEPSSSADANGSSISSKSETIINFTDPLNHVSLQNENRDALNSKSKPKERNCKTTAVAAESKSHTSLADVKRNEQRGLSELHENVSNKAKKSKNSKFNTIGPAIVQGTLSHPFAWLKDFKAPDEFSVPAKNLFDPTNAKRETKHDLQPEPSHGNGKRSIRKTVVKPAENTNISPKLNKQTKTKQQKLTTQLENTNESSSSLKSATIINITDPLQNGLIGNECGANALDNVPEGSVNNTYNQNVNQDGAELQQAAKKSMISRIVYWNPNPEHPLVKCIENSGIPGLNESVKQDLNICTRLYWVAAFCFILAFCIIILLWGTGKFNEHPLKVELVPTELLQVTFHSRRQLLHLQRALENRKSCKLNAKRRSRLFGEVEFQGTLWTENEVVGLMFSVDEVALSTTSFSGQLGVSEFQMSWFHIQLKQAITEKNFSMIDNPNSKLYLHKIVPAMKMGMIKCNELILKCSWNGKTNECLKKIRSSFSSIGIACSFNLATDSSVRRNKTVKSLFEEPVDDDESKYWEKLNMDKYFESLFKKSTKLNGTITLPLTQKVAGHSNGYSQLLYAKIGEFSYSQLDADGFMINLSSLFGDPNIARYGFAVPFNHEAFVAITPEITLANPEIYKIDASARGCYNSTEFHLDFYKHYSLENCLNEMLAKDVLIKCNCAPLSSPKLPNTVVCNSEQQLCVADVERDVYERNPSTVYKQCLPSCSNIVYRYDISYLAYSEKDPPDYVKEQNLDNDTVTSLIHVFMRDITVTGKVRDVKYETFDKVGLLGGIFGFTSGIALINIAYLVLAIVICIFSIRKWRQRSAAKKLAVAAGMGTAQSEETGNTHTNQVPLDETPSNLSPQTEIPL